MQDNNYIFHKNCKLYKKKFSTFSRLIKFSRFLKDLLKIFLVE